MMNRNIAGRIETTTPYIRDLVTAIQKGEIKIPKFQRPYVWKEDQALRLLDSIANSFPVGSLLIWRTAEKIQSERNVGNFSLPDTDDMSPTDYVLDGQQRLTVVYSAFAPGLQNGFDVIYDLKEDVFQVSGADDRLKWQFPLRFVYDTSRLLNFRAALQTLETDGILQAKLDALVDAFNAYRFPVVTLKDLDLTQVCPIFERINSSGTKLSVYDLMVAATYSAEFDLDNHVNRICNSLDPKGFGDIDKESVLKCLSAIGLHTIKEQSIKSLRQKSGDQLENLIIATERSLQQTIDLLSTEFGIHSWDFLSYEALLVICAYLYSRSEKLTAAQLGRLKEWFWRSSFAERYKVGGENFVSRDLQLVAEWIIDGRGLATDFGEPLTVWDFTSTSFRSNNARSRAFILLLSSQRPVDLITGATIDVAEALTGYNKKQFHHILPKAWIAEFSPNHDANVLANICMTSASSNNWIRARDPKEYLPNLIASLGHRAEEVFASNLLPSPGSYDYANLNYRSFTIARGLLLEEHCAKLCGF